MAKKFSELRSRMPVDAQERARARADAILAELKLAELRQARGFSQQEIADAMQIQQPSVARMEKRKDIYLSTLRSHIEAMGGELELIARFSDGAVKIDI
jgi:predicted XRE-type DNA-binding protein